MNTTIRAHGRVSQFIGWMLTGMGILFLVAVIVLGAVLSGRMLVFIFAPVLLFIGAGVNFWLGSRARLEITPDSFIWCGFVGRARRLAWRDVDRILIPAPGSRPRLAAVARLRDGSFAEIEALWQSPTSPATYLGQADHRRAQQALIAGHQAYLFRR